MSGLTDAQRALRKTGVGGSEVAAVLGVATRKTEDGSPKTAFDVWVSKLMPLESISSVDAQRGIYLEPGLGDWYLARTGRTRGLAPGTVRHATEPVALCTPDLLAVDGDRLARLVSIKAPRHGWEWGPDGSRDVPLDYVLQLQWEHLVCSSFLLSGTLDSRLDLAAFVGGELRIYTFEADLELQAEMLRAVVAWWRQHVDTGGEPVAPPLDASMGARVWLRKRFPGVAGAEVRPATPAEEVLLTQLHEAERAQQQAEAAYDVVRRNVELAIGDAAGLDGVEGVVTWKPDSRGSRRFVKHWKRSSTERKTS